MNRRLELLDKFATVHLLVIGDLMLDRFIWGEVERLSPEAPVPVLRVVSEDASLGGAANVVQNIRALGGRVTACGIVGRDNAGRRVLQALRNAGASVSGVISDEDFQTIQKSRIIASPHHQQIVRLDRESRRPIARRTLGKIRDFVASNAARYGIVISDYGKGVIHEELLQHVAAAASREKLVTIVDPKKENYEGYRFPTLITPNKTEASEASGIAIHDEMSLGAAGKKLVRKWRAQAVLITRGAEGMSLFRRRLAPKHFPTEPRDVFDVTGAGDTVVAMCALALASGDAGFDEAAVLANVAAGFVGDEIGTVAVPAAKIRKLIEDRDR